MNYKLLAITAAMFSSVCFASPINMVSTDETVQSIVTTIAAQSPSGDPVYCDFVKATEVDENATKSGDLEVQALITCGPGTAKQHMNTIKVYVKALVGSEGVITTGVQLDQKL